MTKEFNGMLITMKALEDALKIEKYSDIVEIMGELRKIVDYFEENVDDRTWPLPKYREMLFIY